MASLTIDPVGQKFPEGTAVSLYDRKGTSFNESQKGTARGNSPQTVTNGAVTFTGLTGGANYWLAASVNSTWEADAVSADPATASAVDETGDLDITGNITASGGIGVNGASAQAKAAAITSPTAPGTTYDQTKATSAKTAIDAIIAVLKNAGLTS